MLPDASARIVKPTPSGMLASRMASGRGARSALVVDDDKFMQLVLGDMLRGHGITQITVAVNGVTALEAMRHMGAAPDVVVCDLNMPGADGFQLMEQLGAAGFGGGVILVSGMDARTMNSAALMARFHRLNILATLTKPVDAVALGTALAAWAARA